MAKKALRYCKGTGTVNRGHESASECHEVQVRRCLSAYRGRESATEAARVTREVVRVPIEDVSLLYNMPRECCRSLGAKTLR